MSNKAYADRSKSTVRDRARHYCLLGFLAGPAMYLVFNTPYLQTPDGYFTLAAGSIGSWLMLRLMVRLAMGPEHNRFERRAQRLHQPGSIEVADYTGAIQPLSDEIEKYTPAKIIPDVEHREAPDSPPAEPLWQPSAHEIRFIALMGGLGLIGIYMIVDQVFVTWSAATFRIFVLVLTWMIFTGGLFHKSYGTEILHVQLNISALIRGGIITGLLLLASLFGMALAWDYPIEGLAFNLWFFGGLGIAAFGLGYVFVLFDGRDADAQDIELHESHLEDLEVKNTDTRIATAELRSHRQSAVSSHRISTRPVKQPQIFDEKDPVPFLLALIIFVIILMTVSD